MLYEPVGRFEVLKIPLFMIADRAGAGVAYYVRSFGFRVSSGQQRNDFSPALRDTTLLMETVS